MLKPNKKYMTMAIEKAKQGVITGQTPFGACIVKNGKVLACEHNVVFKSTDITAHAEINAIRVACKKTGSVDLKGSVIYSTCEPCPMCFSACHWANISMIVYGAKIKNAKFAGFNELDISNKRLRTLGGSSIEIVDGFMKEDNEELFRFWMNKKDKRSY
ncbi:MAG: nucleoside deaminase [Candidatus Zapsychrus exili]|nr:nucleoside deaminase [Candidatus Zapsychrus exili]